MSRAGLQGQENLRKPLFAAVNMGDQLVFTQDYVFKSPSAAAAIVVGNNMNGWLSWKDKDGKTMDTVVRQSAG